MTKYLLNVDLFTIESICTFSVMSVRTVFDLFSFLDSVQLVRHKLIPGLLLALRQILPTGNLLVSDGY